MCISSSLLFSFLTVALGGAAASSAHGRSNESLRFEAEKPLLTRHSVHHKYSEKELDAVLADLFASDSQEDPKALVVYVHGRGHEPKKSFRDSILGTNNRVIEKIEQHGVLVLGVNWDSAPSFWHPMCGRPIDEAVAAGPLLARTAHALLTHRAEHLPMWRNRKVVLLVHSMGGFVLREAMSRSGVSEDIASLFDMRVISESDVPVAGSTQWIPAEPPGQTYVVTNPSDDVLARSTNCDKAGNPEIGQRLGTLRASDAPATAGVVYVQLSAGKRHRVFTKVGADNNPLVCRVMEALLRGTDPKLESSWRVSSHGYVVPQQNNPTDACITEGLADQDDDD